MNSVAQSILETVNISLFNAEPTPQKLYQLYKELRYAGLEECDPELIFHKVQMFFKKRTIQNQCKLFTHMFHLHYTDQMRVLFSLSYRTSDVSNETLSDMACDVYRLLLPYDIEALGIDERILFGALTECFKPKYFENEWQISLTRLSSNVRKVLIAKNRTEQLAKVEELFSSLESSAVEPEKKSTPVKQSGIPESTLGDSTLKDATKVKEGELEYIKSVLKSFEECQLPEMLSTDLYPSPKRHPKVTQFFLLVKNYNLVIHNEEMTFKEIFEELNFVANSIQEVGKEICELCEKNINEVVSTHEHAMKIA